MLYLIILIRDYIQHYNYMLLHNKKYSIFKKIKNFFKYIINLKWYYTFNLIKNEIIGFKSKNNFLNYSSFFIFYTFESIISILHTKQKKFIRIVFTDFRYLMNVNNFLNTHIKNSVFNLFNKGILSAIYSIFTISPYYIYCIKKIYYDGFLSLSPSFLGYLFGNIIYMFSFRYFPKIFILFYSWERLNILLGFFISIYIAHTLFTEHCVYEFFPQIRFGLELRLTPTVEVEYLPLTEAVYIYDDFIEFISPLFRQITIIDTYKQFPFYLGILFALCDQPRIFPILSNYVPSLAPTLLEFLVEENKSIFLLLGYYIGYFMIILIGFYLCYLLRLLAYELAKINYAELSRRFHRFFAQDKDEFDVYHYNKLDEKERSLFTTRSPIVGLAIFGVKVRYIAASLIYTLSFSTILYYPFGYFLFGPLGFVSQDTIFYSTWFDPYSLDDPSEMFSIALIRKETGPFKFHALDRGRYGYFPMYSQEFPFVPETFRFRPEMIKYRHFNFVDFIERSVEALPVYVKFLPNFRLSKAASYKEKAFAMLFGALAGNNKEYRMIEFRAMPRMAKDLVEHSKPFYALKKNLKIRRMVEKDRNTLQRSGFKSIGFTFKDSFMLYARALPIIQDLVYVGYVYQDKYSHFKANIDRFYNWYIDPFNRYIETPYFAFSTAVLRNTINIPEEIRPIDTGTRISRLFDLVVRVPHTKTMSYPTNFVFMNRDLKNIDDPQESNYFQKLGLWKFFKLRDIKTLNSFQKKYYKKKDFYKKRLYDFYFVDNINYPSNVTNSNMFNIYNSFNAFGKYFVKLKSSDDIGKFINLRDKELYKKYKDSFIPPYAEELVKPSKTYNDYIIQHKMDQNLINKFVFSLFDTEEDKSLQIVDSFYKTGVYVFSVWKKGMPNLFFNKILSSFVNKYKSKDEVMRKINVFIPLTKRDPLVDELRQKKVNQVTRKKSYNEQSTKNYMRTLHRLNRIRVKVSLDMEILSPVLYNKDKFLLYLRRYSWTFSKISKILFNLVYFVVFKKYVSPNQEIDLHYKKLYYMQLINSLRKYKFKMLPEKSLKHPAKLAFFTNICKSFSNRFHNQQFKGTLVRARRAYSCTQGKKYFVKKRLKNRFFNVLKYDNLYFCDDITLKYHSELDYNIEDQQNKIIMNNKVISKLKNSTHFIGTNRYNYGYWLSLRKILFGLTKNKNLLLNYLHKPRESDYVPNTKMEDKNRGKRGLWTPYEYKKFMDKVYKSQLNDYDIELNKLYNFLKIYKDNKLSLKNSTIPVFLERLNYHPLNLFTNMKSKNSYLSQQDLSEFSIVRTEQKNKEEYHEDSFGRIYEHRTHYTFKKLSELFINLKQRIIRVRAMKTLYKNWPFTKEQINKFFLSFRQPTSKHTWLEFLDIIGKNIFWEPITLHLDTYAHSCEIYNLMEGEKGEEFVEAPFCNMFEAHNYHAIMHEFSLRDSPAWMRRIFFQDVAGHEEDSLLTYLTFKERVRKYAPSFIRHMAFYRVYDTGELDKRKQTLPLVMFQYVNKPTLGGLYWKGNDLSVSFNAIFRNFVMYLLSLIYFWYRINTKVIFFPYNTRKTQAKYYDISKKRRDFQIKKMQYRIRSYFNTVINKIEFPKNTYTKIHNKKIKMEFISNKSLSKKQNSSYKMGIQWRTKNISLDKKKVIKKTSK